MSGLIGGSINMTDITEVKSGAAPTTDLICPLMSGQIVPVQMTPGGVVEPGKARLAPSVVTCAREKCRWWDETAEECTAKLIAGALVALSHSVPQITAVLEPATESPLVQIGDVLVRIGDNIDRIRIAFNKANALKP